MVSNSKYQQILNHHLTDPIRKLKQGRGWIMANVFFHNNINIKRVTNGPAF